MEALTSTKVEMDNLDYSKSSNYANSLPSSLEDMDMLSETSNVEHDTELIEMLHNHDATANSLGAPDKIVELENARLKQQVLTLRKNNQELGALLLEERQTFETRNKHIAMELDAIVQKQNAVENEMPKLKRRLALQKEDFHNIEISNAYSEEIMAKEESDTTLKEYVLLRCHLHFRKVTNELELVRKELEENKKKNGRASEELEYNSFELKSSLDSAKGKYRKAEDEIRKYETLTKELEVKVCELTATVEKLKRKDAGYDDLFTRHAWLQKECQTLKDAKLRQDTLQAATKENNQILQQDMQDMAKKLEHIRSAKCHLSNENASLESQLQRKEDHLSQLQRQIDAAKHSQTSLYDEIVKSKEETKNTYQHQFAKELENLQTTSKKELNDIRTRGQEVWERENQILRIARDDSVSELSRTRLALTELQQRMESLKITHTDKLAKLNSTVMSLRNELKMKVFELHQRSISYEERMTQLQESAAECDMLRQKVEVHKNEFSEMESESAKTISQLEGTVNTQLEKLRHYEELENDLDEAVLGAGTTDVKTIDFSSTSDSLDLLGSMPTKSNRRIRQSVVLARQLFSARHDVDNLRSIIHDLTAEKKKIEIEHERSKQLMSNLQQPHHFLINRLQQLEIQIENLQATIQSAKIQMDDQKEKYQKAAAEKLQLQNEMEVVLTRRADLQSIRHMVQTLQLNQAATKKNQLVEACKLTLGSSSKISVNEIKSLYDASAMTRPHGANHQGVLPKWYQKLRE